MKQKIKKIVDRSVAYPALTLEDSFVIGEKLRSAFSTHQFSRESAATALGHEKTSGTAARKVAALVQFGLLARSGNAYRISELLNNILYPDNEDVKREAIVEAAKSPKLYSSIIAKFRGKSLPVMLDNILVTNEHISSKVARKVASDFRKTAEFANFLKNGIILDEMLGTELSQNAPQISDKQEDIDFPAKQKPSHSIPTGSMTIPLDSGIKIIFPQEMAYRVSLGEFAEAIKAIENVAEKTSLSLSGGHIQGAEGK